MNIVRDEHTVSPLSIISEDIWFTFLSVSQPSACQDSIVSDAWNDISIFPIETRIESVSTESCVVKDSVTVFGPQVEEGPGLPRGDVVGGQPGGGDTDQVSGGSTSPTLSCVRVVAMEDVSSPDLDIRVPDVCPEVLSLEHGGGEATHTAGP